jgi:hypothetical protein
MCLLISILNALGWLWLAFAAIAFVTALTRELTGRARELYVSSYLRIVSWVIPAILLGMSWGMWRIAHALG